MNNKLDFESSTLQTIFDKDEFNNFEKIVQHTAMEFPEIQGVLITGSLVQRIRLPNPVEPIEMTPIQKAYGNIVCRSRLRFFPQLDSDLDVWLLIDDLKIHSELYKKLDERALELINWYSAQKNLDIGAWIDKKHEAFDAYYKQVSLYPSSWTENNEVPYFAIGFKETLVDNIGAELKSARDRIKHFFTKQYPRKFLQVRAYTSQIFNLRPEKIFLKDNLIDRTPFAYYLRDWLDLQNNCIIIYTNKEKNQQIYPFDENGRIPGQEIAESIGWTDRHSNYCTYQMKERMKQ